MMPHLILRDSGGPILFIRSAYASIYRVYAFLLFRLSFYAAATLIIGAFHLAQVDISIVSVFVIYISYQYQER